MLSPPCGGGGGGGGRLRPVVAAATALAVFSRIQSAADARAATSEKHTHTGTSLRGGRRRPWAGRGREGSRAEA
ncbi:unnamed protein product [Lampetra planeri]